VDLAPPTIVSITPDTSAAGLPSDTTIEVTFSEPMNKVATQAAFQSANLGGVTFDWPSDDVMAVTPNVPLQYATGTSLATVAKLYGFSITTAAQDEAGNALEAATTSEFTTLRQITMSLPRIDNYYEYDDGTVRTLVHPANGAGVLVGDAYNLQFTNNESVRALLVFDLGSLPIGIEKFVSATLSTSLCCAQGNPASLGSLKVDHIYLPTVNNTMIDVAALASVGTLAATPTAGAKALVVTSAIEDDYANRNARANRCQLRVQFAQATNDDDASDLVTVDDTSGAAAAKVTAVFLIP
jgi:hypothetical protein